tara:strand:- start:6093 stop:6815 length:723 start_codon:yes stop_codon:yes gene_type:complete
MKKLSELTDRELVALTEEEIQRFIAVERMEAGVAKPVPPVLQDVPEVPEPSHVYHCVKRGYTDIVLLESASDAAEVVSLLSKMKVFSEDYTYGVTSSDRKFAKPVESLTTDTVKLYTQVKYNELSKDMRQSKNVSEGNAKEQGRFESEVKAEKACVSAVWDEIYEAQGRIGSHQRVLSRWNEYCETAWDQQVAFSFLRKAFTDAEIVATAEYRYEENALDFLYSQAKQAGLVVAIVCAND